MTAIVDLMQRELIATGGEASLSHGMVVLEVPQAAVLGTVRRLNRVRVDLFLACLRSTGPARIRASTSCRRLFNVHKTSSV